jgi:hypothetical protein
MMPKVLQDTLRQADDGRVTCTLLTDSGRIEGIIEESFFEDFLLQPLPDGGLTPARKLRIVAENSAFLESEAAKQLRLGHREVIIR